MKEISVSNAEFDFPAFVQANLNFLSTMVVEGVHPSYPIVWVDRERGTVEYGPEGGRDCFIDELSDGKQLFFPFSGCNIGDPIECADGVARELDEDSDFIMGDVDCVGFLISLDSAQLSIRSAEHAGGTCQFAPTVQATDCDVFDAPMKVFARSFLSKKGNN